MNRTVNATPSDTGKAIRQVIGKLEQVPRGLDKVLTRTVNRTAQGVRTDAVDLVRERLNLKRKVVSQAFEIRRATWRRPQAVVSAEGRDALPLGNFAPRPTRVGRRKPKKGVSVQVKAKGGRKVIPGTFLTGKTARDGTPVIARRRGKKRYPIRRLYGPGFMPCLRKGRIRREWEQAVSDRYWKNLTHETRHVLKGAGLL